MENFKNHIAETVGMEQFDKIRNEGRLLIEYVRGSTSYGLNTPTSDIDTGGVYMCSPEELLGYNLYKEEVSDEKSDNKWFELSNFIRLLVKANPNVLEALFVPDECIIGEVHPIMQYLRDNRDIFLTKKCFTTIFGYATSQIVKARGLNKKIVNPIYERKTPLDFTFTFKNQGSQNIIDWLNERGLKQEYCGLNKIPHMNDMYGLFYDWGGHYHSLTDEEFSSTYNIKFRVNLQSYFNIDFDLWQDFKEFCNKLPVYHYRGLTTEQVSHTTQLRLSSIDDKNDKPICWISYNGAAFQDHCKKYKEYKDWEKNRNPVRYQSNLNKNYDSKNIMHCFRLIHMGKEIAEGKGMIIRRTWDHDFLMDIRNHKYEYDELIPILEKEKNEMNELMKNSTLPDTVDSEKLNKMLFDLRMLQLKEFIK